MKTGFRQFAAVALYTFRADIRRPLGLLLALIMLLFMLVLPGLTAFNLGDESRMARDGALAVFLVTGMILAFAAPAAARYDHAASGALAMTLAKPIERPALLFGRFAAWAGLVFWYGLLALAGILLVERIALFAPYFDSRLALMAAAAIAVVLAYAAWANCRRRASFCAAAALTMLPALLAALAATVAFDCVKGRGGLALTPWLRVLPAGCLIIMAMLIMMSVSAFFTMRLPLPWAAAACLFVFTGGMLSDYIALRASSAAVAWLARLLPAWQDFWMADALTGGGKIAMVYVAAAAVYAGLSVAAWFCGALFLFCRMELR